MEIRIIILAFWVLILSAVIIGVIVGIKTIEERLSDLERRERRTTSDIMELSSEVDFLKISANARKELELTKERKEKMANYLVVHAGDSVTNRAAALYDIATGKVIKEDE